MKQYLMDIAVVLSALVEQDGYWSPLTPIYLALGSDMDRYHQVVTLMARAGLVTTTADTVTLTSFGVEKAEIINRAIPK